MKNQYTILPIILFALLIFAITSSTKGQNTVPISDTSKKYKVVVKTIENREGKVNTDSIIQQFMIATDKPVDNYQIVQIINGETIINTIQSDSISEIMVGSWENGSSHQFITEFDYSSKVNGTVKEYIIKGDGKQSIANDIVVETLTENELNQKQILKIETSDTSKELIFISDDGENITIERNGELVLINKEDQIDNIKCKMDIRQDENGKDVIVVETKIILDELTQNDSDLLKSGGIESSSKRPDFDYVKFYADQAESTIHIKFKLADMSDITIKVVDMLGRNIFYETRTNFEGEYNKRIDLNTSAKGTYIMQISQGKQFITRKIMVE